MRCRRRPGRCSASWARRPANSPRTPLAMDHPLAGAPLCRLAEISDGEGRGFILGTGAEQVALFVVRDGDHAFAYVNACPHQGTPLAWGGFDGEGRFVGADSGNILCATQDR